MNPRKYLSKPVKYIACVLIGLGALAYVSLQSRENELNELEQRLAEPVSLPDARNVS